MTGSSPSAAWTSGPSSNACLLQATLTILINWYWLDCHVRTSQEKIVLMQESYSCQPEWDFLQYSIKVNAAIQTLEIRRVKKHRGLYHCFFEEKQSPILIKNNLETGEFFDSILFQAGIFITRYITKRKIRRETWDKSYVDLRIREASLQLSNTEESCALIPICPPAHCGLGTVCIK